MTALCLKELPSLRRKKKKGLKDCLKNIKRVDGEYDRPLPERITEPTKEEKERLERLLEKYPRLKEK
nr:MAG TPA: hypothetical protein [Caudoviricetes sp.]